MPSWQLYILPVKVYWSILPGRKTYSHISPNMHNARLHRAATALVKLTKLIFAGVTGTPVNGDSQAGVPGKSG